MSEHNPKCYDCATAIGPLYPRPDGGMQCRGCRQLNKRDAPVIERVPKTDPSPVNTAGLAPLVVKTAARKPRFEDVKVTFQGIELSGAIDVGWETPAAKELPKDQVAFFDTITAPNPSRTLISISQGSLKCPKCANRVVEGILDAEANFVCLGCDLADTTVRPCVVCAEPVTPRPSLIDIDTFCSNACWVRFFSVDPVPTTEVPSHNVVTEAVRSWYTGDETPRDPSPHKAL